MSYGSLCYLVKRKNRPHEYHKEYFTVQSNIVTQEDVEARLKADDSVIDFKPTIYGMSIDDFLSLCNSTPLETKTRNPFEEGYNE